MDDSPLGRNLIVAFFVPVIFISSCDICFVGHPYQKVKVGTNTNYLPLAARRASRQALAMKPLVLEYEVINQKTV